MSSTKLLVPINLKTSAHWALAEIDRTAQSVKYYDRLEGSFLFDIHFRATSGSDRILSDNNLRPSLGLPGAR